MKNIVSILSRKQSGFANARRVLTAVLFILGVYGIWLWVFCRFYVPPDYMAVIISKTGKTLPDGQILAEKGEKGIWKEVLGEGRYFLNPIIYEWVLKPVIEIDIGKIGVMTSKIGKDLPRGDFLAEKDEKGIQKTILGPGKYRLNPYGFEVAIQDALEIPIGYVGIVTSLAGKEAKEGDFAVIGEKGVLKDVLQPGLYYINPRQYQVNIVEVGTNQISLLGYDSFNQSQGRNQEVIRTKKTDALAKQMVVQSELLEQKLEKTQERQNMYKQSLMSQAPAQRDSRTDSGVQFEKTRERPSMYNPSLMNQPPVQRDSRVDAGLQSVLQFIEFPSKDGFDIQLDMTVEFEFLPEKSAFIFKEYGDLFQVVEKIILPQILSISRLKGSAYGARDFIVGDGREKFQDELVSKLKETLGAKGIGIRSALIRHVIVPDDIRTPIQDASIAIETNLTNIEKQETAKKLAELNTELSLIDQRREQVQQETQKIKAEIQANELKEVAEIEATTIKLASEIENKTALIHAEKVRKIGKAESDVIQMTGLAEANGFKLKVSALGDPSAYSLYEFSNDLPKDLNLVIAHTGQGTLWTDLNKSLAGNLSSLKLLETTDKK